MKHTLYLFFFWCCFFGALPFGISQLTVQGLLHVEGDALLYVEPDLVIETAEGSIENNGTVLAEGNITKEAAASYSTTSTTGSRKVILQGESPVQRITGNFTGDQSFYELSLNKRAGMVELNSTIEVSQFFNLIQGKLRTDVDGGTQASDYQHELYISNPAPNALSGNFTVLNANNFVEGRLKRRVLGTGTYSFPVGLTENNPLSVTFNEAAPLSDLTATLEGGRSTPIGTTFSCSNIPTTSVDCALGRWNVQATAADYDYDIRFSPSAALLPTCQGATSFVVAKNAIVDCDTNGNSTDNISSSQTGGFGLFDLPAVLSMGTEDCPMPNPPTVTSNGNSRVAVEWDPVAGADGYVFQIRIKGMERWLITFPTQKTLLFVRGPNNLQYEYRVKTVCAGGDSDYTDIFELNTKNEGTLTSASSRTADDIDIADYISAITVFPNPIIDQLQVSYTPISEDAKVLVHHINGQLVEDAILIKNQSIHTIDASNWENGFYIMSIKEQGQPIVSQKVTKIAGR